MKNMSFLKKRDFNSELEKVLEEKDFTEDVKNILISIFYKIEITYKDYACVKNYPLNQDLFLSEIVDLIKFNCEKIKFIDTNKKENEKTGKNQIIIDVNLRKKVLKTIPNEISMLFGIYDLKPKYYFIPEKYSYFKDELQRILCIGGNLEKTECIRNFNGWGWDYISDNKIDIMPNLVYQNFRILFGKKFLEKWEDDDSFKRDYIKTFQNALINEFGKDVENKLYISLGKILITIMEKDKKRSLKENLKVLKEKFEKISDNEKYLQYITDKKKEISKKIEKADKILADKKLMELNLNKLARNENKTITTIEQLKKHLMKKREDFKLEIAKLSSLMTPNNYLEKKGELQDQIEIFSNIKLVDYTKLEKKSCLVELQKIFLECIEKRVDDINDKLDIYNMILILRYYKRLYITNKEKIEDIDELNTKVEEILGKVIHKGYNNNFINLFVDNLSDNFQIINRIINSQMINLKNCEVQFEKNDIINLLIFDENNLENKIALENCYDGIKFDKKTKVFKF